ncbi:hypothetical protein M5K25_027618 [Dendrobium thyrsiflorum]|uniref:Uncharacterized protein n=1 Tax=Dendrobium thyrsiflorum TaxID=117978 RepID=A0ABD0TU96_DENTH
MQVHRILCKIIQLKTGRVRKEVMVLCHHQEGEKRGLGSLSSPGGRKRRYWFSAITRKLGHLRINCPNLKEHLIKEKVKRRQSLKMANASGQKFSLSSSSMILIIREPSSSGREPLLLPTFRQRKRTFFLPQRTALPSNLSAKVENLLPPAENRSFSNLSAKAENICPFSPLPGRGPMSFSPLLGDGREPSSSDREPLLLLTLRQRQRTFFLRQRTALPSNLLAKVENLLPPAKNCSFSNLSAKAENLCPFHHSLEYRSPRPKKIQDLRVNRIGTGHRICRSRSCPALVGFFFHRPFGENVKLEEIMIGMLIFTFSDNANMVVTQGSSTEATMIQFGSKNNAQITFTGPQSNVVKVEFVPIKAIKNVHEEVLSLLVEFSSSMYEAYRLTETLEESVRVRERLKFGEKERSCEGLSEKITEVSQVLCEDSSQCLGSLPSPGSGEKGGSSSLPEEEQFSAGGRVVLCHHQGVVRKESGSLPSPRSDEKGVVLCRHQGVVKKEVSSLVDQVFRGRETSSIFLPLTDLEKPKYRLHDSKSNQIWMRSDDEGKSNKTYIHSLETPSPSIALSTSVSPSSPTARRRSPYKVFFFFLFHHYTVMAENPSSFLRQRTATLPFSPLHGEGRGPFFLSPAENRNSSLFHHSTVKAENPSSFPRQRTATLPFSPLHDEGRVPFFLSHHSTMRAEYPSSFLTTPRRRWWWRLVETKETVELLSEPGSILGALLLLLVHVRIHIGLKLLVLGFKCIKLGFKGLKPFHQLIYLSMLAERSWCRNWVRCLFRLSFLRFFPCLSMFWMEASVVEDVEGVRTYVLFHPPGEGREPGTMLKNFTREPSEEMGRNLKKKKTILALGNLPLSPRPSAPCLQPPLPRTSQKSSSIGSTPPTLRRRRRRGLAVKIEGRGVRFRDAPPFSCHNRGPRDHPDRRRRAQPLHTTRRWMRRVPSHRGLDQQAQRQSRGRHGERAC